MVGNQNESGHPGDPERSLGGQGMVGNQNSPNLLIGTSASLGGQGMVGNQNEQTAANEEELV